MHDHNHAPLQLPQLVRSWPELLPACVLLEEYRLPPHFVMSSHEHESGHGWLIIEGGFEQHTEDGVVWRHPGELQAYGGRAIHQIRTGDRGGSCLVFENVLRSSDYGKRHDHRATQGIADALQPLLAGGGDSERAREVLTSLLNAIQARRPQRAEPAWVQDADAYIAGHFRERLRAGDVARHVRMHRAHVVREYRLFRGRTIADQVRMLRLTWARDLLMRQVLPLSELALEAGFADQSHFTREFSGRYGTSPSRYFAAPLQ